jgi:hypothetical protein
MKTIIVLAACVCSLFLTGCVSTRQFVPLPDQTKKVEDSSKGRIYVMRPTSFGSAISMNVSDDGKLIGVTGPQGFLCWERKPGETIVSSTAEGVSQVPLTVQPGQDYYIFQHIRMGLLIAENELEIVNDVVGEKTLKKCNPPKIEAPPPSGIATNGVAQP